MKQQLTFTKCKIVLLGTLLGFSLNSISAPNSMTRAGLPANESVQALQGVGLESHIGRKVTTSLFFKNEMGESVTLGQFLQSGKPIILSLVYYGCKSLCNYHLNGLTEGLRGLDWSVGQKFDVVAISFDPREGSDLAAGKKQSYMKEYNRPGTQSGWHFLTADQETIGQITSDVGFKYKWNEEMNEWSHPSAAIIISPDGTINRYLPGVFFQPNDIRLALNESMNGQLGTFIDKLVLFCFRYDEHKSKYSPYVINIMKIGGGITIMILVLWLASFWWKNRRKQKLVKV